MDTFLKHISEFILERENAVLVNLGKYIPEYKESVHIISELNDGLFKYLENDDTNITLQMKKDILTYLNQKEEARVYSDIFLYLQGIADTMKILKYLN